MRMTVCWSLAALTLTLNGIGGADTVFLRNGDQLTGSVVTMVEGVLTLETQYAGAIPVGWEHVDFLVFDAPLPVVLADGTEVEVALLPMEGMGLEEVSAIAPPSPPPVRWEGRVDFGYALAKGNRSTDLGTLTLLAQRQRPGDSTLSVLLDAANASSEGEETANRARIEGKLDRGAGDSNYRYYLAGLGYDRVRETDLRLELGSGLGRMLVDTPRNRLTAELGASYVRDDLTGGETQNDAKLRLGEAWSCKLDERTSLRQSLALLSAFDELSDYTAEFVLALTLQLSDRMSLTSKVVDSYDSRPAVGTERNDITFATQLGFVFGG